MPDLLANEFNREYLRLVLELDKHIDGYVDAYTGPEDFRAEVMDAGPRPPAALRDDAARVRELIPQEDAGRAKYLDAVLRAVEASIELANGETLDFYDEVRRLYDVEATLVDTATFDAAYAELDAVLEPGGTLAERLNAFRDQFTLPVDRLPAILDLARDITRRRTLQVLELVPGEDVEIALVDDKPWSAYNWYRGGAQSLIEFNTDLPVNALDVLNLFAHEAYPGHHTEHMLKERRLLHDKGYGEQAAALLQSPSAVIAEGIATTAIDIILPGREHYDFTVDAILIAAKLPPALPADLERIAAARQALRYVSGNAAILYHTGQLDEAGVKAYFRTYALASEARAAQMFRFIANPLYRAYIFTYTAGRDLIERAARGHLPGLFKRLLASQILPSELAAMAPPEPPEAG